MPPPKVIVFIDEKNVYKGARRAFFDPKTDHHACGQFDPAKLGDLICSRLPHGIKEKRELCEVRLYTGTPNPNYDPKSAAAHQRQRLAWEAAGATIIARPLRYLNNAPPGEQKGVDVALAVDFVTLGLDGGYEYDIGVIFSTDTDLKPALEFVATRGSPRAEVACWWSSTAQSYLSIKDGPRIWSCRLAIDDYRSVADYTDYNKS